MKFTHTICLLILFTLCNIAAKSQDNNALANKYLIVLDVQEYYTKANLPDISAQKIIDSINYVIGKTESNRVIYVKRAHELLNLSLSFPYIYISYDFPAMRFDKRLNLVNDHIFTREQPCAFAMKELNDFLIQNNAKEIIIIGLMADEYLYESAIKGKELGYDIYVIPEAVEGNSPEKKTKAIDQLKKEGIKIIGIH